MSKYSNSIAKSRKNNNNILWNVPQVTSHSRKPDDTAFNSTSRKAWFHLENRQAPSCYLSVQKHILHSNRTKGSGRGRIMRQQKQRKTTEPNVLFHHLLVLSNRTLNYSGISRKANAVGWLAGIEISKWLNWERPASVLQEDDRGLHLTDPSWLGKQAARLSSRLLKIVPVCNICHLISNL